MGGICYVIGTSNTYSNAMSLVLEVCTAMHVIGTRMHSNAMSLVLQELNMRHVMLDRYPCVDRGGLRSPRYETKVSEPLPGTKKIPKSEKRTTAAMPEPLKFVWQRSKA